MSKLETLERPETKPTTVSPEAEAPKKAMSKNTQLKLKVLVSILLLVALVHFGKIDLSKSWQAALNANPYLLGLATLLFLSTMVLNAHRWQILAEKVGFRQPLAKLTQYCFVGQFFNLFFPSTVGGDVSRCFYLSKGNGKWMNALYSVLADRTFGISILFLMSSLGILLGPGAANLPWQLKWPVFGGTVFVFGLLPLVPKISALVLGKDNWVTRKLTDSEAKVYWQDRKLALVSLAWSLVLQIVMVACHVLIGYSLGLTQVPIWYYFVFYPCTAVLGFVSPTFNGVGIREWCYTYFLTLMGVDRSHALTFAVIWFGLITLTSLVGGLVYVGGHLKLSKEEMESMQHHSLQES